MPKLIAKKIWGCKSCPQGCYMGIPDVNLPSRKTPTKCLYNYDGLHTPAKWRKVYHARFIKFESFEEIPDYD